MKPLFGYLFLALGISCGIASNSFAKVSEGFSKLWDTPNLVITPHVSSDSEGNYIEMVLKIFFKNLKLFLEKKELINQIDRKLGY